MYDASAVFVFCMCALATESHVTFVVSDFCFQVTRDLLIDQSQSSGPEVSSEEDQIQQIIYGVLRQG